MHSIFDLILSMLTSIIVLITRIYKRELGPDVYDRHRGRVVREEEPLSAWLLNGVMYSWPLDVLDHTGLVRSWLKRHSWRARQSHTTYASALEIPEFVDFYGIQMSDFLQGNPSDFRNFNEFFIREVRPECRPIARDGVISAADSRLTVFNTLRDARRLFIKGRRFSFAGLLGKQHGHLLRRFGERCNIANFRLHPMDYHRFHAPVTGRITVLDHVPGQYYTVKTKALNSDVNVLCENTRTVVLIETSDQGEVLFVAIGAEDVGTVTMRVTEGELVRKGDELGMFQFGGSDIVVVFDRDLVWDPDLLRWSKISIETLVHANERIAKFAE